MGDGQQGPALASSVTAGRVVVAGDVTLDWHLARTRNLVDAGTAWNAADRTEIYGERGGAALMAALMTEVAVTLASTRLAVEVAGPGAPTGPIVPGDPSVHHAYAIWSKVPCRRGDRDRRTWRAEEFLGLDRARVEEPETARDATVVEASAGLLIEPTSLGSDQGTVTYEGP